MFAKNNNCIINSSTIIALSKIFLSQFLQVKPNFYFDGFVVYDNSFSQKKW